MPSDQCTLCDRRKSTARNLWVGLLARKVANDDVFAGGFTFPGHMAEWCVETACPPLQWRDRAGFTPGFLRSVAV